MLGLHRLLSCIGTTAAVAPSNQPGLMDHPTAVNVSCSVGFRNKNQCNTITQTILHNYIDNGNYGYRIIIIVVVSEHQNVDTRYENNTRGENRRTKSAKPAKPTPSISHVFGIA